VVAPLRNITERARRRMDTRIPEDCVNGAVDVVRWVAVPPDDVSDVFHPRRVAVKTCGAGF
jgi:hypothetical protein